MREFKKINKEAKPVVKKIPPKKILPLKTYLFWLKSNRGTDQKAIYSLPAYYKEEDIQGALEHWCSFYAAWEQSICSYGFKRIKVLKGKELKEKWDVICKRMGKVREEYNTIREMFNIREFK